MNLLLLDDRDFPSADPTHAVVTDARRCGHICGVLRAVPGDRLVVGRLRGALGTGTVQAASAEQVVLSVVLETPPPPRLPVLLLLALPRPKVLRRTLQDLAALGVARLVLLQAARVEKGFWDSPLLSPEAIDSALRLGLEQARDTRPPEVLLRRRFRPFVEDELPALAEGHRCLLAHPYAPTPLSPSVPGEPVALAVGPEGGWVEFEVGLLETAAGFQAVSVGPRILRSETALPYLLGRLAPSL